jgi:hypothetical protein
LFIALGGGGTVSALLIVLLPVLVLLQLYVLNNTTGVAFILGLHYMCQPIFWPSSGS